MSKRGVRRNWRLWSAAAAALALTSGPALAATGSVSDGSGRSSTGPCDWSMYQHDPGRNAAGSCSTIDATTVSRLHPQWFVPTTADVTASPAVATVGGKRYVYEGDNGGTFYQIDALTGTVVHRVTVRPGSTTKCSNGAHVDSHVPSYGEITSSADVAVVQNGHSAAQTLVFVGIGGSVFALDATSLHCVWARDLDPAHPTSGLEAESSPVIFKKSKGLTEVIIGSDANEPSNGGSAPPGVQAFNAVNGALLWKFEPENNRTDTTLSDSSQSNGCGDVWSSPALDPKGLPNGQGLIISTTGNCPNGSAHPAVPASPNPHCQNHPAPPQMEGIAAINATSGCLVWRWSEPTNQYSDPSFSDGGDTDFGAAPILTKIVTKAGPTPTVIEGGKSGFMYALNESTGALTWGKQVAQPGEAGLFGGGIGGFIGSSALGQSTSTDGLTGTPARPTVFGATAILAPFSNNTSTGLQPDTTLATDHDPTRAASLHAIDAATGQETWQAPVSLPSYAATTYVNGVVFAPSTTGFSIAAYDANSGAPLWAFPLGAAPSSAAAVVGDSIFFAAGTDESPLPTGVPPQEPGIWSFTTGSHAPGSITVTPPVLPGS